MNKFQLNGLTALVTGGNKGIGLAIAEAMAEVGAELILVARDKKRLCTAFNKLKKKGVKVHYYPFDLSNVEEIEDFFDKILNDVGRIDILVNNAGVTTRGPAETISLEDWNRVIKVDLTAVFKLSQIFAKSHIMGKTKGKIINIASLLSETVRRNNAPYAAAKGGIRQLTKAMAVDWAQYRINVNGIGPGYIKTELTLKLQEDKAFDQWVRERTPIGRWGTPEDIAYMAVFLASPASDFITGQIFYIDGGILSCF